MKTVILAGDLGTRLSEETTLIPEPMLELGGKPALWHIKNNFDAHGVEDFIIAAGYKGKIIREYFANFRRQNSDLHIDLKTGQSRGEMALEITMEQVSDYFAAALTV